MKQQLKSQPCPITYQGITYPTLKEFAVAHNLNYSKVLVHHRKGKTAEEIVEHCQFSVSNRKDDPPPETPKRCPVEYNGVQYASLYAAASALGLSPNSLYDLRKRGMDPVESIDYALANLAKAGEGGSGHSNPCEIEGVSYPSQEAALNAYNLSRITVYSRMQREGISFEEAVIRGRNSAVYREPTPSMFFSFHLVPAKTDPTQMILVDLSRSLTYYHCKVEYMRDLLTSTQVLRVGGDSYIFFNKDARGIEVISELPFPIDPDILDVLNGAYAATKLFQMRGTPYLASFQSAKEEAQDIKTLLNTWFSFSCIRDKLCRMFAASEEEQEKTG